MTKKRRTNGKQKLNGIYQSPNVPMSAIRRFAKQVAERWAERIRREIRLRLGLPARPKRR